MADGYGFGAEGDWKTAALVRAMKVMATGLPGELIYGRLYISLCRQQQPGVGCAYAGDMSVHCGGKAHL